MVKQLESSLDLEAMKVASPAYLAATFGARCGSFAASLAATVVVITNRQNRWGIEVNFTLFDVWIAFVAMNMLCAVYSLLTAVLVKKLVSKSWLHHLDLVALNLQTAGLAGAGAIGSVAMWGNEVSGWYAVCRLYRRYCNVGAVSLVLAFAAFLCLGAAASMSRYTRSRHQSAAVRHASTLSVL